MIVQDHVGLAHGVQVDQKELDHRDQRPVAEHRALRASGRARGIEEPREVVGIDRDNRRRGRLAGLYGLEAEVARRARADAHRALDGWEIAADRGHVIAEVLVVDEDPRSRVVQQVRVLGRVKADVHRHHRDAGLHGSQDGLEPLATVRNQHADAVASARTEPDQRVGEAIDAGLGLRKGHDGIAVEPRRARGPALGGAAEQVADVHGQPRRYRKVTHANVTAAESIVKPRVDPMRTMKVVAPATTWINSMFPPALEQGEESHGLGRLRRCPMKIASILKGEGYERGDGRPRPAGQAHRRAGRRWAGYVWLMW